MTANVILATTGNGVARAERGTNGNGYAEDSRAEVDINVVMAAAGEFVEVQGTGESATFSRAQIDDLLNLAKKGIEELLGFQQQALKDVHN